MKRVIHIVSFHQLFDGYPCRKGERSFDAIDKILDVLSKNKHYKAWHLGAQSKFIEDYLKIYPNRKDEVVKYVKEGKLFIGPWYVLPNELIASGETQVRNLLFGHQVCRDLGGVMKIGYLTLACGLNSQTPQIYSGFNIDTVVFPCLCNTKQSKTPEFIWEGSDNTQVLSTGFYAMRSNGVHYDEDKRSEGGLIQKDLIFPDLNPNFYSEDIESVVDVIEKEKEFFTSPHVLLVEVSNHNDLPKETPNLIDKVNDLTTDDVIQGSLYDYLWELKDSIDFTKLNVVRKEINNCRSQDLTLLLDGCSLSFFQDIKQRIFEAEVWLKFFAEPWSIVANLLGNSEDRYTLKEAWASHIQNQSLDVFSDFNGNQFYNDIRKSLQQSIKLSKDIFNKSFNYVLNNIDLKDFPDDGIYFVILNTLPFKRSKILELILDIPLEIDCGEVVIKELSGKELSFQLIEKKEIKPVFEHSTNIQIKQYRCLVELKNLPAMGYKTFQVFPALSTKEKRKKLLSPASHCLENDYLKVNINENGTFKVFSKETGALYSGIGYFLDESNLKTDGTHEIQPAVTTEALKPSIKLLYNGPYGAAYKINYIWNTPSEINKKTKERSSKLDTIKVSSIISLDRFSKYLDMVVSFVNKASNHTLKICFPIDFKTDFSYAGGRFDIVSRRIGNTKKFSVKGREPVTFLMNNFVGISHDDDNFTVITDGLTEYEILKGKKQIAAITLFRDIGSINNPIKGRYHLCFYPHLGRWESGQIMNETYSHNIGLKVFWQKKSAGNLPTQIEFLRISPDDLIFSTLKYIESGEGIVLRLFNPTNYVIDGEIFTYLPIRSVELLSLEELVIDFLEIDNENQFSIKVKPKKIITLKLTFRNN